MNVGIECPGCHTKFIVMPSDLWKAIGDQWGPEGEVQFEEWLRAEEAKTGDRLAVAGADRGYACPECGTRGVLPSDD